MQEYNVVFHYSVRVEADSEESAEDMAWIEFGNADPTNAKDFACTVEEIDEPTYWSDLANMTHKESVSKFNFCVCEDNDNVESYYDDCPREEK